MAYKLSNFFDFLGREVYRYFFVSLVIALTLFAIEATFANVLQNFLFTLGITQNQSTNSWFQFSPNEPLKIILLMCSLGIFKSICTYLKSFVEGTICQGYNRLQRERILTYSLTSHEDVSTVTSLSHFSDAVTLSGGALQNISSFLINVIVALMLFILGLKIAKYEMLLGTLTVFLIFLIIKNTNEKSSSAGRCLAVEWEGATRTLINGIKHNLFLRIYGLVRQETLNGNRHLLDYQKLQKIYQHFTSIKIALPALVGPIVISTLGYLGRYKFDTEPEKLLSFFYIFMRYLQCLSETSVAMNNFRFNWPQVLIVYSWYQKHKKSDSGTNHSKINSTHSENISNKPVISDINVSLESVTFSHKNQPNIFENFSLEVRPGNPLIVVGESGSGKSTLLSLILGIVQPNSGQVKINQVPSSEIRNQIFHSIGYVSAEPYLVEGSVRKNLLLGNSRSNEIHDTELYSSLKISCAFDFVSALPNKLDFRIAENAPLSTGQKQRLSIARAILRNPQLLILDEGTSHLDTQTEEAIFENLKDTLKKITTIIVTHRPQIKVSEVQILELSSNAKKQYEKQTI